MIDGWRAIELFGRHRTDQVVVTTMSSARAWPRVSQRPELDLPLLECMGKASSLGLGIALACPERGVIVLDGDGSLLTNLGALVTIAGLAPRNLIHVVLQGGTYDTSGGHPTPDQGRLDFAGLAQAAGYREAVTIDDAASLDSALPKLLRSVGPTFICLRVNTRWASGEMPEGGTRQACAVVQRALVGPAAIGLSPPAPASAP
jgi:thiamine pyrophosphate-dependent acetolactate synthase large subunit-like protein